MTSEMIPYRDTIRRQLTSMVILFSSLVAGVLIAGLVVYETTTITRESRVDLQVLDT